MQVVWYENKALVFTSSPPAESSPRLDATGITDLSPANLLQKFDNSNTLHIVSPNPDETFARFAAAMRCVKAAGGIVENGSGEVLMIRRRGWWDLPKGHIEAGESAEAAALREVAEETGLETPRTLCLLTTTQHVYDTYGEWEMKRTWWYRMRSVGTERLTPQSDEEITEARWLKGSELWQCVSQSYGTIREVFDSWVKSHD